MSSPLDDALKRTADAVARFHVPDDMIAWAATSLEGMPAGDRVRLEVEALLDAIVEIASAHGGHCADDCPVCKSIRNALAVAMGVVRAEADIALKAMYSE